MEWSCGYTDQMLHAELIVWREGNSSIALRPDVSALLPQRNVRIGSLTTGMQCVIDTAACQQYRTTVTDLRALSTKKRDNIPTW